MKALDVIEGVGHLSKMVFTITIYTLTKEESEN
jgi:hypothetical protein